MWVFFFCACFLKRHWFLSSFREIRFAFFERQSFPQNSIRDLLSTHRRLHISFLRCVFFPVDSLPKFRFIVGKELIAGNPENPFSERHQMHKRSDCVISFVDFLKTDLRRFLWQSEHHTIETQTNILKRHSTFWSSKNFWIEIIRWDCREICSIAKLIWLVFVSNVTHVFEINELSQWTQNSEFVNWSTRIFMKIFSFIIHY